MSNVIQFPQPGTPVRTAAGTKRMEAWEEALIERVFARYPPGAVRMALAILKHWPAEEEDKP